MQLLCVHVRVRVRVPCAQNDHGHAPPPGRYLSSLCSFLDFAAFLSFRSSRKLEEAFLAESAEYEPAFKSKGRVNHDNFASLIGVDHPPPGPPDFSKPKEATHYADFIEYFRKEIAQKGVEAVMHEVQQLPFFSLQPLPCAQRHQPCCLLVPRDRGL